MKKILFVCGGNTCRSPMAKVILEQLLRERGLGSEIAVDSAAKGRPTHSTATDKAKQAIRELYGKDLLTSHKSKSVNEVNLHEFDLILTMMGSHKRGLPAEKTYTLKEYSGLKGHVCDPYGQNVEAYRECRDEIKGCLEQAIDRIINDL